MASKLCLGLVALAFPIALLTHMYHEDPALVEQYAEQLTGQKGVMGHVVQQGKGLLQSTVGDLPDLGNFLGGDAPSSPAALGEGNGSTPGGGEGGGEGKFGGEDDVSQTEMDDISSLIDQMEQEEKSALTRLGKPLPARLQTKGQAEAEASTPAFTSWNLPAGEVVRARGGAKAGAAEGAGADPTASVDKVGQGRGGRRRRKNSKRDDAAKTDPTDKVYIETPPEIQKILRQIDQRRKKEDTMSSPRAPPRGGKGAKGALAAKGPYGSTNHFHEAKIRKASVVRGKGKSCSSSSQCPGVAVCVKPRGSRSSARKGRGGGKGQCECPILYSGDEKCGSRPKGMPRCSNSYRINSNPKDISDMADWGTCSVVGSASSIRNGLGTRIDRASAVIRFNDAPTAGYLGAVGSKTTLRVQNIDYCGFTERKGELCLHYSHEPGQREKQCRPQWWRAGGCNIIKPTNRITDYVQWYWHIARPPGVGSQGTNKLSAGFFGVVLALHLCGEVDIYGMTQSATHYYTKRRKNDRTKGGVHKKRFGGRHSWTLERRCIAYLEQGLVPGVRVVR